VFLNSWRGVVLDGGGDGRAPRRWLEQRPEQLHYLHSTLGLRVIKKKKKKVWG